MKKARGNSKREEDGGQAEDEWQFNQKQYDEHGQNCYGDVVRGFRPGGLHSAS